MICNPHTKAWARQRLATELCRQWLSVPDETRAARGSTILERADQSGKRIRPKSQTEVSERARFLLPIRTLPTTSRLPTVENDFGGVLNVEPGTAKFQVHILVLGFFCSVFTERVHTSM